MNGMPFGRLTVAVVSGLLSVAQVAPSPGSEPKLNRLPAGWLYLERDGIDTRRGAYHDSTSGTFVRAEIASQDTVTPWATAIAVKRGGELKERTIEGATLLVATLPTVKGECEEKVVSFLADGISWNLASVLCTDLQRERLSKLVDELHPRLGRWPSTRTSNSRIPSEADVERLLPGAAWPDVESRLGLPAEVVAEAGGGFAVIYDVGRKRTTCHFDQRQRLAKVLSRDARPR